LQRLLGAGPLLLLSLACGDDGAANATTDDTRQTGDPKLEAGVASPGPTADETQGAEEPGAPVDDPLTRDDTNEPALDDGSVDDAVPSPVPDDADDGVQPSSQNPDAGTDTDDPGDGEPSQPDDGGIPQAACMPRCPAGDVRCDQDSVERCIDPGNGCSDWVVVTTCAEDGTVCVQTSSDATCEPPPPSCDDAVQNQDEADVDCGGATCSPCRECTDDGDCPSGSCDAFGQCLPSAESCNPPPASAYVAAHSLRWPLTAAEDGIARPALGNSFGEFQHYPDDPAYIHSGIDIRGLEGDHVWNVANGNIWRPANFAECDEGGGVACRLYVVADDGRYIYYYSHLRFMDSDAMSAELRARVSNAVSTNYEIQPGTHIAEGERLADIADFYDNEWAHLHFSVIDTQLAYDAIDPLQALDMETHTIFDDEPPRIDRVSFTPEVDLGVSVALDEAALPGISCGLSNGWVEFYATIKDSFLTDAGRVQGIPGMLNSIGVESVRTLIRHTKSGELTEIPWYQFDQAPFFCPGMVKGALCPTPMTQQQFYTNSVDNQWGAPDMGTTYAPLLWDISTSSSAYYDVEQYSHRLNNTGGEQGFWDATDLNVPREGGLYQISVEAADQAGNRTAETIFALLGSGPASSTPEGEIAIRDSLTDPGAVPSDLGDGAVAASPDIIVVTQGAAVTLDTEAPSPTLQAGVAYDVYVRVRNIGCGDAEGIRARLSSLRSDLSLADIGLVRITPGDEFAADAQHPGGLTLSPAQQGLLGPFVWIPTATELNGASTRALMAELSGPLDPPSANPVVGNALSLAIVKNDNNIAVRNVAMSSAQVRFGNPTDQAGCVELQVLSTSDGNTRTASLSSASPTLLEQWALLPGVVSRSDGELSVVDFERRKVRTSATSLSAGELLDASISLPETGSSAGSARFSQFVGSELVGEITVARPATSAVSATPPAAAPRAVDPMAPARGSR
jgi:hypothetical protein